MIRKTLLIMSIVGLVLSVGLWGASYVQLTYVHSSWAVGSSQGCLYAFYDYDPAWTQVFNVDLGRFPDLSMCPGISWQTFQGFETSLWPYTGKLHMLVAPDAILHTTARSVLPLWLPLLLCVAATFVCWLGCRKPIATFRRLVAAYAARLINRQNVGRRIGLMLSGLGFVVSMGLFAASLEGYRCTRNGDPMIIAMVANGSVYYASSSRQAMEKFPPAARLGLAMSARGWTWSSRDVMRQTVQSKSWNLWPQMSKSLTYVQIPLYLLCLGFGVMPILWGVREIRTVRRHRLGQCVHCGYDIRGSDGTCPECGLATEMAK